MALLQIAEPGQSTVPHAHNLAVGIDLGTTNSLVASVKSGVAETLQPSIVSYQTDGILVGNSAKAFSVNDPENTIVSAKRLIGRSLSDIQSKYPSLPYDFCGDDNHPEIKTRLGQAVAYGLDTKHEGKQQGVIAVYDLGGGTFDISVLRLNKGVFEVLATGGDAALGGDDFDVTLVDHLIDQAQLSRPLSRKLERQLSQQACNAKEQLSQNDSTEINLVLENGEKWQGTLTKETFNSLISSLVNKTLRACKRTLKDADITTEEVLEVVMVGGSTRVPLVREEVEKYFKKTPLTSIDPDKVVAIGAAIQADILAGNKPDSDMLLLDVIPLSLGLETMGGLVEKVIPRNTTIPVAKAQEFTTFKDGQTAMAVHVLQGERELVEDCRSLARFELRGIPAMTAGAAHIRVTFKVDADGLLQVSAMEKSTGVESSIEVKPSFGLEENQIASMLKASMSNAKQDIEARMVKEQQVEAARVIESVQSAIAADGNLLSEDEANVINEAIAALNKIIQSDVADDIESAIEKLNESTAIFAERRMDSSIKTALAGHSVDEV